MAARGRVSIPAGVRRTIADIKEIAGGHTEEEVYAMLRECNMDPNETAQKLLLQDTFHEVKRKRDKKKEGNKEPSDSQLRHAMQGRGVKGGRGNHSLRHLANTTDLGGRGAISGKDNGVNQNADKGSGSSSINTNMNTKISTSTMPSLSGVLSNIPQPVGPAAVVDKNSNAFGDILNSDSTSMVDMKIDPLAEEVSALGPNVPQSLKQPASILGSCASTSGAVLVPSFECHSLGDVGAAKQNIGSQRRSVEQKVLSHDLPTDSKGTSQSSGSPSFGRSSGSRPSSSYSSHSQQSSGSQKVVPNKEWKPKPTSTTAQASENVVNLDKVPFTVESVPKSTPTSNSVNKEDLLKLDKRFNDLQLPDRQHVIIPDHLQISESEKYGLTFGSFNTSFQQTMGSSNPECAKSSLPPEYESSQELDDIDTGSIPRDLNSCSVHEAADPFSQETLAGKLEKHSPLEVENSSITPEITDLNQCVDASAISGIPQSSIVEATPPYSTFGLLPQLHANQTSSLEISEPQVQQPIDFSTSESYQPTADTDRRLSPFLSPEAAMKYGNIPVLPAQTSQNQEGSNSSVLVSFGSAPPPLATPAAGVVPTSISVPQQSVPVFRQPVGVHVPHYPPNYIQYNQYISPFFLPSATLHPFLGNTAFPQPPSTGAMYPAPGSVAVGPPVKYSPPSFKSGTNTGSQASAGIPGAYSAYASSPSIYTSNAIVANGNSAENDDVASSQFKESSVYIAGQQSEGSTIWIPAPGRDISLQASSFYGVPPQGQHITFATGQAGLGPFGGMYHPAQALAGGAIHPLLQPSQTMVGAVELVGPPGSVYQQPQTQINWGNY